MGMLGTSGKRPLVSRQGIKDQNDCRIQRYLCGKGCKGYTVLCIWLGTVINNYEITMTVKKHFFQNEKKKPR